MKSYYRLPEGVQDLLPAECYNMGLIKRKLEDKFSAEGYVSVQSAALEYYDTYAEIKNRIPQNKMFKLTDSDGSLLVLRPDMTLSVARMAATRALPCYAKIGYFSNVWRYDKTGGLSIREIYQAGVENLGVSNALSDAQTIAFAIECLLDLGVKDFIVDVGHVGFFKGVLEESGLNGEAVEQVRRSVNAKDSVGAQALLKSYGAPEKTVTALSALPTLFGGVDALLRAEKYTDNPNALQALQHLREVYALLESFGLSGYVSFDLGTVKDLSYYSGVVFTGLAKAVGSPVLSGGRYDNLADDFGKHIPAVGFAVGLKRVLIALERQGDLQPLPVPDVVIVAEPGCETDAYRVQKELLQRGKRVEFFTGDIRTAKAEKGADVSLFYITKEGVKEI